MPRSVFTPVVAPFLLLRANLALVAGIPWSSGSPPLLRDRRVVGFVLTAAATTEAVVFRFLVLLRPVVNGELRLFFFFFDAFADDDAALTSSLLPLLLL
jgi:hypothetical protein